MLEIKCDRSTGELHIEMTGKQDFILSELIMALTATIDELVEKRSPKSKTTKEDAQCMLAQTIITVLERIIENSQLIDENLPEPKIMEKTMNDIVKEKLGIDMEDIHLQQIMLNALIEKWAPIMEEHILSNVEMTMLHREVHSCGLTMEDFLDKMIDMKLEGGK